MTAVAAVTAFPMEKVLRRGCAVLYTKITSTIACNSVSFLLVFCFLFCFVLVLFFWGGGGGGEGRGMLVYVEGSPGLGLIRFRVNQVRVSKV